MPQKYAIANLSALIPKIVCYYIAIDSLTLLRGILKLVMNMPTHTKVHPRLRGEYDFPSLTERKTSGSPPLARGILCPALFPQALYKVHPRLRGEYCSLKAIFGLLSGSPPLARGILAVSSEMPYCCRFTPACVGNTMIDNYINMLH